MKYVECSQFTQGLIRQNEQEIKVRQLRVAKELREIEKLRKQNRDLLGRNE